MPKTSEMKNSEFIKKEDVGRGLLGTISGCIKKNVAKEGAEPEYKWCLTFSEIDKPMVLNSTNIQLLEQITGSDDTDHWMGKKIVLYVDPNVSYQGKLIGGVRVRRPKPGSNGTKPPAEAAPPPLPPMNIPVQAQPQINEDPDDDIPF
jgi:hypothetical protein